MLYHLEDIEKIREFENNVRNLGQEVFDISHWDSGSEYNKTLLSKLEMDSIFEPFNYIYSYEIKKDIHLRVQNQLIGGTSKENCSIFFSNSTITIVNICNFLQKNNITNICILQPSYFTVEPCLKSFGLNVKNVSLIYQDRNYKIPVQKILDGGYDAVWITSPIFCTSTYYESQEIVKIQNLLNKGFYVICDESLSIKEYNIRQHLSNTGRFLSFYSPHKVISTNTIKFSCLICNEKYENFFNQWIDLFSGGLSNSSKIAIKHFLTSNYYECLNFHINYTNDIKTKILKLLSINNYLDKISFSHTIGQYMTIFCVSIPYAESIKQDFIKNLIYTTKVSLLPGYLEGFFEEFGFCFRINLTLDESILIASFNRVLTYLNGIYL